MTIDTMLMSAAIAARLHIPRPYDAALHVTIRAVGGSHRLPWATVLVELLDEPTSGSGIPPCQNEEDQQQ